MTKDSPRRLPRQARQSSDGLFRLRSRGRSRQACRHSVDRSPHRRSKEARRQSAVAEIAAASSTGNPSAPVASARRRSPSVSQKTRRAFSPAPRKAECLALPEKKRCASSPEASKAKDLARGSAGRCGLLKPRRVRDRPSRAAKPSMAPELQ